MTTQTQQQEKPRELIAKFIERREKAIELAENILRNGHVEFSFYKESTVNANQESYKEDPVYKKLTEEILLAGSANYIIGDRIITGDPHLDHGVRLKCGDYAEEIRYRRIDERTYTFLLENSPETIAKHLFYNNWKI